MSRSDGIKPVVTDIVFREYLSILVYYITNDAAEFEIRLLSRDLAPDEWHDWDYLPFGSGYSDFLPLTKLTAEAVKAGGVNVVRKWFEDVELVALGGSIGPFDTIGIYGTTQSLTSDPVCVISLENGMILDDHYKFKFKHIGFQISAE